MTIGRGTCTRNANRSYTQEPVGLTFAHALRVKKRWMSDRLPGALLTCSIGNCSSRRRLRMATIIPLTDVRTAANPDARRAALDAFVRDAARAPAAAPGPLADTKGRRMHDLRISVTDRCNFRCVYCMPRDVFDADYHFLPHADLLTFEEIARVARVFVDNGVSKIRLTGGEPLLRRNVERLVEMLARHRRSRPDADDQRRAAREEGKEPRRRRLEARHGEPRFARRRDVPRDERRRLSGGQGARRHRRRRGSRPRAGQGQHGRQARR